MPHGHQLIWETPKEYNGTVSKERETEECDTTINEAITYTGNTGAHIRNMKAQAAEWKEITNCAKISKEGAWNHIRCHALAVETMALNFLHRGWYSHLHRGPFQARLQIFVSMIGFPVFKLERV